MTDFTARQGHSSKFYCRILSNCPLSKYIRTLFRYERDFAMIFLLISYS